MTKYKEHDVVILKDDREVTLLDFLGDGDECIFEDNNNETFFGNVSDIKKSQDYGRTYWCLTVHNCRLISWIVLITVIKVIYIFFIIKKIKRIVFLHTILNK